MIVILYKNIIIFRRRKIKISDSSQDSLSRLIYQYLKDAIINNEIKPKEKIYEKEIAKLFNSSTTPVREAVLMLTAEGFIENNPHRNAVVRETSIEEFFGIQDALVLLDSFAWKAAMREMTDGDLKKLKKMTLKLENYDKPEALEKYLELNYRIHGYVHTFVKPKYMNSLIKKVFYDYIHRLNHVLKSQYRVHPSYQKQFIRAHKEMIKALESKQVPQLIRLIENHWKMFL